MAFLYLDPITDRRYSLGQAQLDQGRAQLLGLRQGFGIDAAFSGFGLQLHRPSDARIERVVLEIDKRPDAFGRLAEAAKLACLSPSRFRARFQAEVGLPFRRYRMWRRMAIVMRAVAQRGSLTNAAIEAGFSSSAHLSSAFKRMFGLSASQIMGMGVTIDMSEDRVVD
jgi:AraC-like DNA-binding protein